MTIPLDRGIPCTDGMQKVESAQTKSSSCAISGASEIIRTAIVAIAFFIALKMAIKVDSSLETQRFQYYKNSRIMLLFIMAKCHVQQ